MRTRGQLPVQAATPDGTRDTREDQRTASGAVLEPLPTVIYLNLFFVFETGSFIGLGPIYGARLAQPGTHSLCFPSSEITHTHHHTWTFCLMWALGLELSSSTLESKHFAFSPGPYFYTS